MACIYEDDLIYVGTNAKLVEEFKKTMVKEYQVTNLGLMKYFFLESGEAIKSGDFSRSREVYYKAA